MYRDIAGELLLVPVYGDVADMESIYTLNGVGARIWELVDGRTPLSGVSASLADEFDIEPGTLESDLLDFARDLESIGALLAA